MYSVAHFTTYNSGICLIGICFSTYMSPKTEEGEGNKELNNEDSQRDVYHKYWIRECGSRVLS